MPWEVSRRSCDGDRELAEELLAEAFTRAWMSWGKVRRPAAPQAWVVRTALNLGVSRWLSGWSGDRPAGEGSTFESQAYLAG
jgi:predicted RNA polymerase sigma factor